MRAVVQRVKRAKVTVEGLAVGEIGKGLLAYIGVEKGDVKADLDFITSKIAGLRVFEDKEGKMNLDIKEAGGGVLLISQFTLLGDCRKGRRPSFDRAEPPATAKEAFEALVESIKATGIRVETGEFQAHMEVESLNGRADNAASRQQEEFLRMFGFHGQYLNFSPKRCLLTKTPVCGGVALPSGLCLKD